MDITKRIKDELYRLYRITDVGVMPSKHEQHLCCHRDEGEDRTCHWKCKVHANYKGRIQA